ncbi:hypothetical protein SCHPADRAFT_937578 [Schizopora paradoxa]|uniref:Uncharacterized protein n=1 Tax=Schizopora paradoxa TaxID=27342 RepID=A0A0H2RXP3_9AGAM|nr:hypothetical protein SCHPADRAFT_937578 [Schizopora paradoxa]
MDSCATQGFIQESYVLLASGLRLRSPAANWPNIQGRRRVELANCPSWIFVLGSGRSPSFSLNLPPPALVVKLGSFRALRMKARLSGIRQMDPGIRLGRLGANAVIGVILQALGLLIDADYNGGGASPLEAGGSSVKTTGTCTVRNMVVLSELEILSDIMPCRLLQELTFHISSHPGSPLNVNHSPHYAKLQFTEINLLRHPPPTYQCTRRSKGHRPRCSGRIAAAARRSLIDKKAGRGELYFSSCNSHSAFFLHPPGGLQAAFPVYGVLVLVLADCIIAGPCFFYEGGTVGVLDEASMKSGWVYTSSGERTVLFYGAS